MRNMSIPPRSREMEKNKPLAREIVRIFMEAVRIKRPFRLRTERRVIQRRTYLVLMRQFMMKIGRGTLQSIIQEQIVALNREYRMEMTIDLFADLLAEYEPQKTRTIAIQTDPTDDDYWMGTDDEESETEKEDQAASESTKKQSQVEGENGTNSQGLVKKAGSLSGKGDVDMVAPESVNETSVVSTEIEGAAEKTTGASVVRTETHAASTSSTVQAVEAKLVVGESSSEELIVSGSKPGVWTEAEKRKAQRYKDEIIKSMGPLGSNYYDEEEDENADEANEPSGHSGDMAPPGVDNHEDVHASFSGNVHDSLPSASDELPVTKFKRAKPYWSKDELARIQIERLLIYRDDPDMYDRVVALEVRGKKFKASNDGNCPRCHFKKNAFVILDFLFPMGDMPEICNYLITKGQAVLWSSQDDSHCKDPPTFLCRGKCPADPSKCGFNLNWNKTDLESVFLLPREDEVEVKEEQKETAELKTEAKEVQENVILPVTSPTVVKIEESLEKVGEQSLESKEKEEIAVEECFDEDRFDEGEIDLNYYKKSVSWVVLDEFTAPNEEVDDDDHFIKTMLALSDAKEDWDKGEAKLWSDEESEGSEEKMEVEDEENQSTDDKKQLYAFSWDSYGGNPWAPVEFTKKNPQNLVMVASGKSHVPRLVNPDGSESQIDESNQPGNELTKDSDVEMPETTSKQESGVSNVTPEATQAVKSGNIESTSGAAEPVADKIKDEGSKESKTDKPEKKIYTADDYPVSIDGTCPYCKSAEVVYIVISNEEENDDDNLPEILQKLLKINYAYKMPKDENEPPSFQCLKCTYGFNLDWSSTSLEDIFHEKLKNDGKSTKQEESISKGYGDSTKTTTTQSLTTSTQSYSYQVPTQAVSSTYTAPGYPPPPVIGMNYFPPMGFPPMPFPPGYFPPPPGYFPPTGFPGYMPGMPGPGYMPYPMMGGPMTGPPPRIAPPAPSAAMPPKPLMGPGASQWPKTGQTETYKSGKYSQASHVTSPTIAKGTVTKGGVATNRGPAAKGTVTKGTITKGAVTGGADKRGTITKGSVTKGTVAKGTVTKGPVPEKVAGKQTRSMGTNSGASMNKRAAASMKESATGSSKSKESSTGSSKSKESSTGSSKSKESSTGSSKSTESSTGSSKLKESATGTSKLKESSTGSSKSTESATGSSKSKESATGSSKSKESATGSSKSTESSTGSSKSTESSTGSSKSTESSTGSSQSKKDGEGLKKITSEEHSDVDVKAKTESLPKNTKDHNEPKKADPIEIVNQASDEKPAPTPVASISEPMPSGVIPPTSPNMAGCQAPTESGNSGKKSAADTFKEDHQTIRFVDDKVEKIADITEELDDEKEGEGRSGSKRLKLQATDNRDAAEKLDGPIDPAVEASQLTETDLEPEKVVTPPVKTARGRGKGRTRGRARAARGRKKRGS